jgi:hypothetical protein
VGRPGAAAAVAAAVALAGGCASDDGPQVLDAARGFYEAHARGDGAAACALLAPGTVEEVEQSAGASCAEAVLDEDVPDVAGVPNVEVFGNEAQVRFDDDTAFLAAFPDGWKVVAAACRARPGRPYECRVKGA